MIEKNSSLEQQMHTLCVIINHNWAQCKRSGVSENSIIMTSKGRGGPIHKEYSNALCP